MSAFGGNLTFGIHLQTKDDSAPGFRSFLSGFNSIVRTASKPITATFRLAQGGLGFLRDVNLGLKPILEGAVHGIDGLIERGGRLELVRKNFEALSGTRLGHTDDLANALQSASLNTLSLVDSMRLANMAFTDDVPLKKLPLIFEFAAKKASALGESTESLARTLMSGIGRGSPMMLKQFGIDIEFVAKNYDRIHGAHAFDDLDFASRRAMVLQAATTKMREELDKLDVTGNEPLFLWKGIKNEIGDATDKIAMAIVRSESFTETLTGMRDILSGIVEHFSGGGSIWEMLTGKGTSGGLFGIAKGAVMDLGEWIFEGIKKGWNILINDVPGKITEGLKWLDTEFLPKLKKAFKEIRGDMIDGLANGIDGSKLGRLLFGEPAKGGGASSGAVDIVETAAEGTAHAVNKLGDFETWSSAFMNMMRFISGRGLPASYKPYIRPAEPSYPPLDLRLGILHGLSSLVYGTAGKLSNRQAAWKDFMEEFKPRAKGEAAQRAAGLLGDEPSEFGLQRSSAGLASDRAQAARWGREMRKASADTERESRIQAAETARDLRRRGWEVNPRQEEMIRDRLRERIGGEKEAQIDQRFPQQAAAVMGKIDEVINIISAGVSALTGVNQKLDVARAA